MIPKDLRAFKANTTFMDLIRDKIDAPKVDKKTAKAEMKQAIEETAKSLGNTPGVTKSSYLDSNMLDWFLDMRTLQKEAMLRQASNMSLENKERLLDFINNSIDPHLAMAKESPKYDFEDKINTWARVFYDTEFTKQDDEGNRIETIPFAWVIGEIKEYIRNNSKYGVQLQLTMETTLSEDRLKKLAEYYKRYTDTSNKGRRTIVLSSADIRDFARVSSTKELVIGGNKYTFDVIPHHAGDRLLTFLNEHYVTDPGASTSSALFKIKTDNEHPSDEQLKSTYWEWLGMGQPFGATLPLYSSISENWSRTAEELIVIFYPEDAMGDEKGQRQVCVGDKIKLRTSDETGIVDGFASRNETGTDIDVIVKWDAPVLGEFNVSEVHPTEIEFYVDKRYGAQRKADGERILVKKPVTYEDGTEQTVLVCPECLAGRHTNEYGMFDHRVGGDPSRMDCKNVGIAEGTDQIVQCQCGMGGYVYETKEDKLVKESVGLHKEAYEPDHPEKIKIKSEYYPKGISEQEIYEYWKSVESKLLPILKDYYVMTYIQADGNVIRKRNDETGKPIRVATPEDYEKYIATGGTVEVHTVLPEERTKIAWVDIDPGKSVSFEKTKEVTRDVYGILDEMDNVKDIQVRFSGGRGFHVIMSLGSPVEIVTIKAALQETLNSYIAEKGDAKLTTGITRDPEGIRLDTSTLNRLGSIRAPYSLHASTGLSDIPVSLEDIDTFQKDNAKITRPFKRDAAVETVPKGYAGSFVVQEHSAEKAGKHWDLRLAWPARDKDLTSYQMKRTEETPEPKAKQGPGVESVLKSWAVPKLDDLLSGKKDKVLAVSVEDHPIAYASFEGNIPEGYGKGDVAIYDTGSFDVLDSAPNKHTIKFNGKLIKGNYTLINTKDSQWLLIKSEEK
jgi:hypothetical protein